MKAHRQVLIAAILLLGAISQIKAQSRVQGVVYDKANQPAAFASVALLAVRDSAIITGRITDERGAFEFKDLNDGDYYLKVSLVGYQTTYSPAFALSPQSRSVNFDKIVLEDLPKALAEVTIKAQRSLIEKKPDRLVMNVENSILTKGATTGELLKMMPLVSTGGDGSIAVRGKNNVMIVIDGKTIPNATLNNILQNLPAEDIEKVEVITNPSAKYDASASGGVINILTKKGLQSGLTGTYRLYTSQGMYGKVYTGVGLSYRKSKVAVLADLNFSFGKMYRHEFFRRNFPGAGTSIENKSAYNTRYKTPTGKIGFDYKINQRHTIGVTLDSYRSTSAINLATGALFRSTFTKPDSSIRSRSDWDYQYALHNLNVNYKGVLDDQGKEISLVATQTLYQQNSEQILHYQSYTDSSGPSGEEHTLKTTSPSDIYITIAQADYVQPMPTNAKLEAGLKYTRISNANRLTQEVYQEEQEHNKFEQNTYYGENVWAGYLNYSAIIQKISWQAGLRAERTSTHVRNILKRNFFNFFPSLSVQRSFGDDYSLSFSYSRKIGRPLYENLIPNRVYVDPYSLREGNPYLKPQYTNNLELAGTLKSLTIIAGYTLTQDAMLDIPMQDPETQITTFSFRNFSRIKNYNLSLVLPANVTPWWQTNNSVTGMFTHLSSAGLDTITYQTQLFSWLFSSTNTFSLGKLWNGELVGSYTATSQEGIFRISPYYSFRVGIGKDIMNGRGNLKLEFDDIFWSERYKGEALVGTINQSFSTYSDTRRVRLAFSYKFGKQTVKTVSGKSLGNENEKNRLKL